MDKQPQPSQADQVLTALHSDSAIDRVTGMVNVLAEVEAITRGASLILQGLGARVLAVKSTDELDQIARDIAAARSQVDRCTAWVSAIGLPLYSLVMEELARTEPDDNTTVH